MKNLLENALRESYDDLRAKYPQYCGCKLCREDVMAYALNKIRPRYTGGGDLGVALANLDLQKDAARATLAVTLLEGMRRVASDPHRDPSRVAKQEATGA